MVGTALARERARVLICVCTGVDVREAKRACDSAREHASKRGAEREEERERGGL